MVRLVTWTLEEREDLGSPPPLRRGRIGPAIPAPVAYDGMGVRVRVRPSYVPGSVGSNHAPAMWMADAEASLRRCHLRVERTNESIAQVQRRNNGSKKSGVVVQDAGEEALVRYRQRVSLGSSLARCNHPLQERRVRFHHHHVFDLQRTQPRHIVSTGRCYLPRRSFS